MEHLVSTEDVSFRYEGRESYALRNLNLQFNEGEFVLVLGATGAGKSTLLRLLNGLIPHFFKGDFSGRVMVEGVDTREATVAQLSRTVGLVFQNPENQIVTLSVQRELAFGPENLGLSKDEIQERVDKYIAKFGLEPLRDRAPHELSGGEKRLVTLASVVAMEPKLMVLDEPTSELDPVNAQRLVDTLEVLHAEGSTVIISEHRVDLLAPMATRVVAMSEGRVVLDGEPGQVLSNLRALREARVKPPKLVELYYELVRREITIDDVPLSVRDLLNLLAREGS